MFEKTNQCAGSAKYYPNIFQADTRHPSIYLTLRRGERPEWVGHPNISLIITDEILGVHSAHFAHCSRRVDIQGSGISCRNGTPFPWLHLMQHWLVEKSAIGGHWSRQRRN